MKEKKQYEFLEIKLCLLEVADIITASPAADEQDRADDPYDTNWWS